MTENEYHQSLSSLGYANPVQKTWQPGQLNGVHKHQMSLYLLIQQGEMTLDIGSAGSMKSTTCRAGDTVEVPANVDHIERVSSNGVTFLVASR
jgi:quercetin dioxygenase-like cupin family protein